MRKDLIRLVLGAAALLGLGSRADAEVTLPKVIGEHMLLQRGRPCAIWGWAAEGEQVKVAFRGAEVAATPGAEGKWTAWVNPGEAGGPFEMTISGSNTIKFTDVLVGEVWVCSGQSNMQWPVSLANNPEAEIAAANDPQLRLFYVERKYADEPQKDVTKAEWTETTPETVKDFSAVAYFFGRELRRELNVPVGLIHTSWGGTPAESWTSKEKLDASPTLRGLLETAEKSIGNYKKAQLEYLAKMGEWKKEVERIKAEKGAAGEGADAKLELPAEPKRPNDPHPFSATRLYNQMIAPLVPYGIQGAIWYQGESNAGRAYQYRELFAAMITDWRDKWGQGDFPFLFVQLANFMERKDQPGDSEWAELREAQARTLALPATGMASAIDIGEAKDIHPRNKQEVGRRLALNALKIAYGKDVIHTGPTYRSCVIRGNEIEVSFKYAGSGLQAAGGLVKGFEVAGPDRKFHWAEARIKDGKMVVLSCPDVSNPVAARYGWANNPEVTLTNSAGLPANPFRTDDWPCVTLGK